MCTILASSRPLFPQWSHHVYPQFLPGSHPNASQNTQYPSNHNSPNIADTRSSNLKHSHHHHRNYANVPSQQQTQHHHYKMANHHINHSNYNNNMNNNMQYSRLGNYHRGHSMNSGNFELLGVNLFYVFLSFFSNKLTSKVHHDIIPIFF